MAIRNATITTLGEWAANPAKMEQFTQVVLLTQRTAAVKQILCLDEPDWLVIEHIRRVCDKHGVACSLKRGLGYVNTHAKTLNGPQRLHVSMLLNLYLGHPESGLAFASDRIVTDGVLDRLIDVYRMYLHVVRATPETADVSFELFHFMVQSYYSGDLDISTCDSCAGAYVNLRVGPSAHCPTCVRLNLAKYSPRAAQFRSLVRQERELEAAGA